MAMGLALEPPGRADGPYQGDSATGATVHDEPYKRADALQRAPGRTPSLGRRFELSVLFVIAIGGGLGTLARYGVSRVIHISTDTFPWATFTTNLVGAFALGL